MSLEQQSIDELKKTFFEITQHSADDYPVDFSAWLHLLQAERIDQLFSYLELHNIGHTPTWAEIKNYLDAIKQ